MMAAGYVKLLLLAAIAVAALHHVASKECKDVVSKQGGCEQILKTVTDACSVNRVKQICQKSCDLCNTSIEPDHAPEPTCYFSPIPHEFQVPLLCEHYIKTSKKVYPCKDDTTVRYGCAQSCGLTCPIEGSGVTVTVNPICEDLNEKTCKELISGIGCDDQKVMPLCLESCGLCPEETSIETVECKDVVSKQGGCQEIFNTVTNACSTKRVKQICRKSCGMCDTIIEPDHAYDTSCPGSPIPFDRSFCLTYIKVSRKAYPCMEDKQVRYRCAQTCGLTCPIEGSGVSITVNPKCGDLNQATCGKLIDIFGCDDQKVMPLCLKSCGLCPEETTETMECTDVIVKPGGCQEIFSAFSKCNVGQNPCSSDSVQKVCRKSCELCSTPASGSASCSDWDPTVCKAAFNPGTCVFAAIKINCPNTCGLC